MTTEDKKAIDDITEMFCHFMGLVHREISTVASVESQLGAAVDLTRIACSISSHTPFACANAKVVACSRSKVVPLAK